VPSPVKSMPVKSAQSQQIVWRYHKSTCKTHLKHHVEDVWVGLLNLIEEYYSVRPTVDVWHVGEMMLDMVSTAELATTQIWRRSLNH
jgi:hypothetical protein